MTYGQIAVLDAWLSQYVPTDSFDRELDIVISTGNIIYELSDMANWDVNEVTDHIAKAGFFFRPDDHLFGHGWMLRIK